MREHSFPSRTTCMRDGHSRSHNRCRKPRAGRAMHSAGSLTAPTDAVAGESIDGVGRPGRPRAARSADRARFVRTSARSAASVKADSRWLIPRVRRCSRRVRGWAAELVVEGDACGEAEEAWRTRSRMPSRVRAPWRSRVSRSLQVQKIDSIRWRIGRGAALGRVRLCARGRTMVASSR